MGVFQETRNWLGRRTTAQLAVGLAVLGALALTLSLLVTGWAVRMDQREKAALRALDDYATMVNKLGTDASMDSEALTEADVAYLSAWLSAFQSGPTRDQGSIERTCSTGEGGAGVRYIQTPVGKPVGLAILGQETGERVQRLGADVYVVALPKGTLCEGRAVEAVVVRRHYGPLNIVVGRVVEGSGRAYGWTVLGIVVTGLVILVSGLVAAFFARRRLTTALAGVSHALDRAAVGDFSVRAPEVAVAPELTELTAQVNRTLDRLEELLSWLRDSADQLAHDFRTPLARAATRLDRLRTGQEADAAELAAQARNDIRALTRAMNEAMALRDGEAWAFERVDMAQIVEAAAELYQPLAEERGIEIEVTTSTALALGVRSLLQRAVTNLVDNAVKYSPNGGRIHLTAEPFGEGARVTVQDQGPGFDPGGISPGAPLDRTEDQALESHGMGLAFVRAILRRHGASMTIDDAAPGAIVRLEFRR